MYSYKLSEGGVHTKQDKPVIVQLKWIQLYQKTNRGQLAVHATHG
jgi:hypothetical protein